MNRQNDPRIKRPYHFVIASMLVAIIAFDGFIFLKRYLQENNSFVDKSGTLKYSGKLDPNTASQNALQALPAFHKGQARSIVKFRQEYRQKGRSGPCFKTLEDLDKVYGIGPKTVQKAKKYLRFPEKPQSK